MFKIVLFLRNFELVDLFDDEAIEQVSCVPFRYGIRLGEAPFFRYNRSRLKQVYRFNTIKFLR